MKDYDYKKFKIKSVSHIGDCTVVECDDGAKSWYKNGVIHREDGPAYCNTESLLHGFKMWYKHGERHREDGPTIEYCKLISFLNIINRIIYWFKSRK